jgi:hypothetical protein
MTIPESSSPRQLQKISNLFLVAKRHPDFFDADTDSDPDPDADDTLSLFLLTDYPTRLRAILVASCGNRGVL